MSNQKSSRSATKEKLVTLEELNELVATCPRIRSIDAVPVLESGDPDNRELFRQFFLRQIELARAIVHLRYPFALYLRDQISEAVADREIKRAQVLGKDFDPEVLRESVRRRHFGRALETREQLLGGRSQEQKERERVRTQMLRHIHGAVLKAAELYDLTEDASKHRRKGDASLKAAEDRLFLWIVNSLSCFALLQMVALSEHENNIPVREGEGARVREQKIKAHRQMLLVARDCERWRSHIVRVNMNLAHRHVNMSAGQGDLQVRLGNACDGLLQAVDRYNALLPAPFEGFCPYWVRQAIKRGHQQLGSLISTPINVQNNAERVRAFLADCQNLAGISADKVTEEMMLKGFDYRDLKGRPAKMPAIRDASNGRKMSPEALKKALSRPSVRSIDSPINDNGEGDGDAYPQYASDEPDAAHTHMDNERAVQMRTLIERSTNPAERLVLALKTNWSDLTTASRDYIKDLAKCSIESSRRHAERAAIRGGPRIARIQIMSNFQPAVPAPAEAPNESADACS